MAKYALTTMDNPYNPFTQFKEWFAYDAHLGYNSSQLLSRLLVTSDELSQADQDAILESTIDSIIKNLNFNGQFKKVLNPNHPQT